MDIQAFFKTSNWEAPKTDGVAASITLFNDGLDLEAFDAAILFVPEYRWQTGDHINAPIADAVIDELSKFHLHNTEANLLYMGEFVLGNSIADTESGLIEVIGELIKFKVVPLLIGGSKELTYAAYKAFELQEQVVNVASVDPYLNIEDADGHGYIGRIIKNQPNYLFNYANLAYQTYLVSQNELELSEELYFEAYRLGLLRGDIYSAEPVIRGAEILSCSMDAVRSSDFRASSNPQPNGIFAEEACQLMRYAGLTDKNQVVLITDLNLEKLIQSISDLRLVAEMLWCFIDGFYHRRPELPSKRKEGFLKYRVPLRDDEFQMVFYKSVNTDRWWMEIPVPPQYANKYRKHHMVPCDYQDYLIATSDDLPERWWKAYKKML
ncbi:MAG: arginase [Salibacteraceae bacterium]